MSLLNNPNALLNKAQLIAKTAKASPAAIFSHLFFNWKTQVESIWKHPNPQLVLNALGTEAAELFDLSAKLAYFLESLKPGCTATTLALLKPFTVNPDGTITIIVEEEE